MMPQILIPQAVAAVGPQFLRERGYELRVGCGAAPEALRAQIADCDAILLRTAQVTRALMEAAPRLKIVAKHGIGVDNVDVEAATELGIWVTNAPLSNANTVAEHTLGFLVALARHFSDFDRAVRAGDFEVRNRVNGIDLAGKTLGLVGLGRIGSLVARKAALGLDMQVVGFDARAAAPEYVEKIGSLDEVLERADFVSLHVPFTPQTRHLIGAREFALMKRTAYFVNVSRGEVVDEAALIAALSNGTIAGAALDVFEVEPPSCEHPLFALQNVIVTPHSAALTVEATQRMSLHAAQCIDQVLRGETPAWPLNAPASEAQAMRCS